MSIASSAPSSAPALPVASALGPPQEAHTPPEAQLPLSSLRRFTVEEYHALIDAGFFAEDESFELLCGFLVHKMGKKRAHTLATQQLRELIEKMLVGFYADAQEPITTSDSEPEPAVSVMRGKRREYRSHQPLARDTLLVAEVADSTLAQDRGLKKSIYAKAGIPVYWIVNLVDRQIEIYTQPTGPAPEPGYADCQIYAAEAHVPVAIDGREVGQIAVKDILP